MTRRGVARLIFVAGLSGSGKSTAMAALEDMGFYCVDSLPAELVPQFLDLCDQAASPIDKIAVAVAAREEPFLRSFPGVVRKLREAGAKVDVIFLDCANETLEIRYRETRRVHPLSPEGSVRRGVRRERELLVELASLADHRIDTTALNVHQLKQAIVAYVTGEARRTTVNVVSFGFRYGTPHSAELLFDVRFLPNPYFEESLRARTGCEAPVADFVLEGAEGAAFLRRLQDFLDYLLPLYDREGKAYVTLGVGCTGGQHRSVAVAEALGRWLRDKGREVNLDHRDVEKAQ